MASTFDEDAFDRGLGAPSAPTAPSKFDDAEFMKGLGPSSTRASTAAPISEDQEDAEFQRALGQSGVDWSKVGTDSPPSSGPATDWSKFPDASRSGELLRHAVVGGGREGRGQSPAERLEFNQIGSFGDL